MSGNVGVDSRESLIAAAAQSRTPAPTSGIWRFEERIFTARRLSLWGWCFLAAYVCAFAIRWFAGKWVIGQTGRPLFIDFVWIWVGGRFALAGNAAGVYHHPAFAAAQASLIGGPPPGGVPFHYWVYPPTLMLIAAPLALLPYLAAFFAWLATTVCIFIAATYAILPCSLAVVLALLPCAVIMNVAVGQAAFLTAGLFGFALLWMRRRPYLSGILLGLLTYKPQLGVFFPFALVITGQWRVIAGALVSASLFGGAAALLLGADSWVLFARSLQTHNPATFLPTRSLEAMNQTVFGLMHWAGAGLAAAWAAHLAVAVLAAALACLIWLRPGPYSLKAAAFCVGALMATPFMLIYDLTALSVPAAFLVKDGLVSGFLPGERLALAGCLLALFLFGLMPIGPIVMLAMLCLVVRRARYAARPA